MTEPNSHKVIVITPTIASRPFEVLEQSILSVKWQSYDTNNITHIVCTDGYYDTFLNHKLQQYNVSYCATEKEPSKTYGGYVRDWVHKNQIHKYSNAKYVCYLDDDNILFPNYIKTMVNAIENSTDPAVKFAISKTVHLGPLPQHLLPAPAILNGIPPVLQNIDTIQILSEIDAIEDIGWEVRGSDNGGYFNDGYTYERLGQKYSYVEVPEILSIHL